MGRSPRLATSTRAVGRPAFNSIGSAARKYSPGMIGIWFIFFYSLAGPVILTALGPHPSAGLRAVARRCLAQAARFRACGRWHGRRRYRIVDRDELGAVGKRALDLNRPDHLR